MNTNRNPLGGFIFCLVLAIGCFAFVAYSVMTARSTGAVVDSKIVELSKIVVFVGIFALIMAFGFALPNMIRYKRNKNGVQADGNDIFNEVNMKNALEKYMPIGEAMVAGVRVVTSESSAVCAFDGCVLTDDSLVPADTEDLVTVSKKKFCTYDMYLGITQNAFVVADCVPCRYYYGFNEAPIKNKADIQRVTEEISLVNVGKYFRLEDIESFKTKKGFAGSMNCHLVMKNGSYFKFMIPASGGLSGGMPRHQEYRDRILACLTENAMS